MNGTDDVGGARLLPWAGSGGKPCYLVTDGTGYLSRVADNIESVQLGMAGELLDHTADMLADHKVTSAQLRFLAARMAEALRDVHRIAESRGARLAALAHDGPDGIDGGDRVMRADSMTRFRESEPPAPPRSPRTV